MKDLCRTSTTGFEKSFAIYGWKATALFGGGWLAHELYQMYQEEHIIIPSYCWRCNHLSEVRKPLFRVALIIASLGGMFFGPRNYRALKRQ